jgi:gliding motility-associated-like protein
MLLETDWDGNPNWSRVLYLPQASLTPGKVASLPGGDLVLTAWSYNSLAQSRAHLVGIAADGSQVQWAQELYTGDAGNSLRALEIAADGSILAGGGTRPSPFFGAWWFFRTDGAGQVPDCCAFPQSLFAVQDTAPQFSDVDVTLVPAVFNSVPAAFDTASLPVYLETPCPALDTAFALSDSVLCPGECLTIAVPDPATSLMYEWTFEGGMPATDSSVTPVPVCYMEPGRYDVALRVSSERCSRSARQELTVRSGEILPNAFTPNGDQVNDVFRPQPACKPENYRLEIYNRWGKKVFEGTDPAAGWNGDDGDTPAPSDVYAWVVYYDTTVDGKRKSLRQSGDVALLR